MENISNFGNFVSKKSNRRVMNLKEDTSWYRFFATNLIWLTMWWLPILLQSYLVPLIFHPQRLGSIPWHPPYWITVSSVETFLTYLGIFVSFVYGATIMTLDFCERRDLRLSARRSVWALLGYLVSYFIYAPVSYVLTPILTHIPYGILIIGNLIRSIVGFYIARMGLQSVVEEVC